MLSEQEKRPIINQAERNISFSNYTALSLLLNQHQWLLEEDFWFDKIIEIIKIYPGNNIKKFINIPLIRDKIAELISGSPVFYHRIVEAIQQNRANSIVLQNIFKAAGLEIKLPESAIKVETFADRKLDESPTSSKKSLDKSKIKPGTVYYLASVVSKRPKNQPEKSFWRDFIMSISEKNHLEFGFNSNEIRQSHRTLKKPEHRFKTTKSGQVVDTIDPNRIHQYTATEKEELSKPRSMSIIAPELGYSPPVFGEYLEEIRGEKGGLVGVIFSTDDPEKTSNLLPTHIFRRNASTAARFYYKPTAATMGQYFQQEMLPSIAALIEEKYLKENNEVLTRVKWGDNGRIGIFLDNLKSRIIGQMRAIDLQNIVGKPVGIVFYKKDAPPKKSIYDYDLTQQQLDLVQGLNSNLTDVKVMSILIKCLHNSDEYKNLESYLESIELKQQFIYLLTQGHISYITEKVILEKFLDISLTSLTPEQHVEFLKNINHKLNNNLSKLNNDLKQFMLDCAKETIEELEVLEKSMLKSQFQAGFAVARNALEQEADQGVVAIQTAEDQEYTNKHKEFMDGVSHLNYQQAARSKEEAEQLKKNSNLKEAPPRQNTFSNSSEEQNLERDQLMVVHEAVRKNKGEAGVKILQNLLKEGYSLDELHPSSGVTPLHIAITYGEFAQAEFLIDTGVDVNKKNNQGKSPLDLIDAKISSERDQVKLQKYQDLKIKMEKALAAKKEDFPAETKLQSTLNQFVQDLVPKPASLTFLRENPDLYKEYIPNLVPLIIPLPETTDASSVFSPTELFSSDSSPTSNVSSGVANLLLEQELLEYIKKDEVFALRDFLSQNPEFKNYTDSKGNSLLHLAAERVNIAMVKMLLQEMNLPPDQKNREGLAPIHIIASNQTTNTTIVNACIEIINEFKQAGANFNARIGEGEYNPTPLYLAALTAQKPRIVETLLQNGADFNLQYLAPRSKSTTINQLKKVVSRGNPSVETKTLDKLVVQQITTDTKLKKNTAALLAIKSAIEIKKAAKKISPKFAQK